MATVQVALNGPSPAAVQARLEEVARATELSLSPVSVTASFTVGEPTTGHEITSAIHGLSLSENEIRAKLAPFENEDVDPRTGVRFVVLP
jgi:hypothetical protein